MTEVTSSDFCIAITREDEVWEAEALPVAVIESLDGVIGALKQLPSIGGVIGLVAVGDDFFVIIRVTRSQVSLFVSDLTASVDWPLASGSPRVPRHRGALRRGPGPGAAGRRPVDPG